MVAVPSLNSIFNYQKETLFYNKVSFSFYPNATSKIIITTNPIATPIVPMLE